MSGHLAEVPLWAAIVAALLALLGSVLTLLGTIGLVRLASFYDRIHAPTLGTSWGTMGIMLASALLFTVAGDRLIVHEVVIGALITTTTPVTMMILGRAALFRGDGSPGSRVRGATALKATIPDADPSEHSPPQAG